MNILYRRGKGVVDRPGLNMGHDNLASDTDVWLEG